MIRSPISNRYVVMSLPEFTSVNVEPEIKQKTLPLPVRFSSKTRAINLDYLALITRG